MLHFILTVYFVTTTGMPYTLRFDGKYPANTCAVMWTKVVPHIPEHSTILALTCIKELDI